MPKTPDLKIFPPPDETAADDDKALEDLDDADAFDDDFDDDFDSDDDFYDDWEDDGDD